MVTVQEPVNILLVDDRPENLLALEAILEPLEQNLVRAQSGEEALRQLLAQEFAVILLDVQMPGLSGFETARLIKARERSRHIPIIFLTAISKEDEYVFEGYAVGAVDYMSKPFQPDVLRSKVMVFVDLYRKQEQLRHQEQLLREHERRELELRHKVELWERDARMAEIFESAMDAMITFGKDRRVTRFNAAAEKMFGISADAAIGNEIGVLFPGRMRREQVERLIARAAERKHTPAGQPSGSGVELLTACRGDGEEFPFETTISCLTLPSGDLYTIIARDVSERIGAEEAVRVQAVSLSNTTRELRILNEQLQERTRELEGAMQARSRFYASMSHELRTPINAIIGYNTLLLEEIYGSLNSKQVHGLHRTQRAAKHLLELVNDVLDLSKIEAGKMDIKLQPTVFPGLIEDLFVTVRPMAEERDSSLSLEHVGDPCTIVTDPRRVRQILLNLLSNAIKFGLGKPISVTSTAREDGWMQVEVKDHGTGIEPGDLDRIFDEFVQLSRSQEHEGTGLGLPISRRLAQLLGGRMEATSAPGEGSTFRIVLPQSISLGESERQDNAPVHELESETQLEEAARQQG